MFLIIGLANRRLQSFVVHLAVDCNTSSFRLRSVALRNDTSVAWPTRLPHSFGIAIKKGNESEASHQLSITFIPTPRSSYGKASLHRSTRTKANLFGFELLAPEQQAAGPRHVCELIYELKAKE